MSELNTVKQAVELTRSGITDATTATVHAGEVLREKADAFAALRLTGVVSVLQAGVDEIEAALAAVSEHLDGSTEDLSQAESWAGQTEIEPVTVAVSKASVDIDQVRTLTATAVSATETYRQQSFRTRPTTPELGTPRSSP